MKKLIAVTFLLVVVGIAANAQTVTNNELKSLLQKSVTYFPKVKEVEQSVQLAEQKLKLTELMNLRGYAIWSHQFKRKQK